MQQLRVKPDTRSAGAATKEVHDAAFPRALRGEFPGDGQADCFYDDVGPATTGNLAYPAQSSLGLIEIENDALVRAQPDRVIDLQLTPCDGHNTRAAHCFCHADKHETDRAQ